MTSLRLGTLRLGIDLGGTKIEIVALDERGNELVRRRVPTPSAQGYDAVLAAIAALVREVEHELGARGTVGVGTPGALSPATGLLRNSNTL
jgi:fructokinase